MNQDAESDQLIRLLGRIGTGLHAIRDLAELAIAEGIDPHHLNSALISLAEIAGQQLDTCQRILDAPILGGRVDFN